MYLREQRAAGWDTHGFCGFRPEELRRQPGVFGRRHPDVEARGDRRRPLPEGGHHGTDETITPISSGIDSAN